MPSRLRRALLENLPLKLLSLALAVLLYLLVRPAPTGEGPKNGARVPAAATTGPVSAPRVPDGGSTERRQ